MPHSIFDSNRQSLNNEFEAKILHETYFRFGVAMIENGINGRERHNTTAVYRWQSGRGVTCMPPYSIQSETIEKQRVASCELRARNGNNFRSAAAIFQNGINRWEWSGTVSNNLKTKSSIREATDTLVYTDNFRLADAIAEFWPDTARSNDWIGCFVTYIILGPFCDTLTVVKLKLFSRDRMCCVKTGDQRLLGDSGLGHWS